jgi:hypothetical protein
MMFRKFRLASSITITQHVSLASSGAFRYIRSPSANNAATFLVPNYVRVKASGEGFQQEKKTTPAQWACNEWVTHTHEMNTLETLKDMGRLTKGNRMDIPCDAKLRRCNIHVNEQSVTDENLGILSETQPLELSTSGVLAPLSSSGSAGGGTTPMDLLLLFSFSDLGVDVMPLAAVGPVLPVALVDVGLRLVLLLFFEEAIESFDFLSVLSD